MVYWSRLTGFVMGFLAGAVLWGRLAQTDADKLLVWIAAGVFGLGVAYIMDGVVSPSDRR